MMLVIGLLGYWVIGYWLLVIGYWLLSYCVIDIFFKPL